MIHGLANPKFLKGELVKERSYMKSWKKREVAEKSLKSKAQPMG